MEVNTIKLYCENGYVPFVYVCFICYQVKDCGHFWATYGDDATEQTLEQIQAECQAHMSNRGAKVRHSVSQQNYCKIFVYQLIIQ